MNGEALLRAMEDIDADLLYEARAESRKMAVPFGMGRFAAAAVLVLFAVGAALVYGLFVRPSAYVYLDCRESVELRLNARGRVLSVLPEARDNGSLSGQTAYKAVEIIISDLIADGSLSADENTLMIGSYGLKRQEAGQLTDTVIEVLDGMDFGTSVAEVLCADTESDRYSSPATAAVAGYISSCIDGLSHDSLRGLTANELNILLTEAEPPKDGIRVTGKPSQAQTIGYENAVKRALSLSSLDQSDISELLVNYSAYRGKLVYLVRLRAGDRGEAYFINAATGAAEQALKAPSAEIDEAVEREIKQAPHDERETAAQPLNNDPTAADVTEERESSAPPATQPALAETLVHDISAEADRRAEITMKELSFILLSPPEDARRIGFGTLFEGQCFTESADERLDRGEVRIITSPGGLNSFLEEYRYPYADESGAALSADFGEAYFESHTLIAVSCAFTDASYYTKLTELSSGDSLYAEVSMSYGESRPGGYTCRALSLYEVEKGSVSPDLELTVY